MSNIDKIASMLTDDPDIFEESKSEPVVTRQALTEGAVSEYKTEGRAEERQNLIQFMREGNRFRPIGEVELHDTLPPAAYTADSDMQGPYLKLFQPITDDLIMFEDSKMNAVLNEVNKFWELKPNFSKLGYLHNRGILLYGPPGTGKTCLIHQITESMVGAGDLVFHASNVYDLKNVLGAFRQVEPDRRTVVVLEDMDEYVGHQEREMLQLLDGASATDNVLFLGSTNYIERFPPRLLRPGRFDKKVHIDYPPINGRLAYLQAKLEGIEETTVIEELAEKTSDFSFGHLRELVIAGYAFQEDLDLTITRLRKLDTGSLPLRESKEIELHRRTIRG